MYDHGHDRGARRAGVLTSFGPAALVSLVTGVAVNNEALAQQAIFTDAATQPAKGLVSVRQLFRYTSYEDDGADDGSVERDVSEWMSRTQITYGITGQLAATADVPLLYRDEDRAGGGDDHEWGVGDVLLSLKWRVLQKDYAPTSRALISLVGGAEVPTGDEPFSSNSIDPFIGAVYTHVHGRHGWNLALNYEFTTGGDARPLEAGEGLADAFRYDAAYLFRVVPTEYTADTKASWYAVLELNGVWETNGDSELMISPGILYEAWEMALELGVQLPLASDVDERAEKNWSIMFGVRLLF